MFISWFCNGNSTNLHANFFPIYTVTSPTPQNSAIDKDNKFCLSFFVQSKFLIYLKTNILKKKKCGKGFRLSLNYFGSKFICIIYRYGTNYKQCHHVHNFSTMLSISNELKFTKFLSRYIIKLKLRF